MKEEKIDLILYCDGACRGNPGPSSYGIFAHLSDSTEIARGGMFLGPGTNNSAEWYGAIGSLQFAKDVLASPSKFKVSRVIIRMDSMLVVKQLTGQWKIKEPRLRVFYDQATKIVKDIKTQVTFEWIPREENSIADAVANQCLDQRSTISLILPEKQIAKHPKLKKVLGERKKGNSRRIQFSVDENVYNALQKTARDRQSTTTKIIINAVKQYLKI